MFTDLETGLIAFTGALFGFLAGQYIRVRISVERLRKKEDSSHEGS